MSSNNLNEALISHFITEANFAFDQLSRESQTKVDYQFWAYSACSNMSLALLMDKNTSPLPRWSELFAQAAPFIENINIHLEISTFLQTEPVPEDDDYEYLHNLMNQRILLEAFLINAAKVDSFEEIRSSIRIARKNSFVFDNELIENSPEVGLKLASWAVTQYPGITFSKHSFSWWTSAKDFIKTEDVSFNSLLKHTFYQAEDNSIIATSITRIHQQPKFYATQKADSQIQLVASAKTPEVMYLKSKSKLFANISFNVGVDKHGIATLRILSESSDKYEKSTLLSNYSIAISMGENNKIGSYIIIGDTAKFVIQEELLPVRKLLISLFDLDKNFVESFTLSVDIDE